MLPTQQGPQTGKSEIAASCKRQSEDRRTRIALRVQAILNQFWISDAASDVVRALELEGWLDVLESLSDAEIRMAWAEYQKTGPRSAAGKLLKPDAGALFRIANDARRAAMSQRIAAMRDAEREADELEYLHRQASKPSAERAAQIIRDAGIAISVTPNQQDDAL